MSGLRQIRAGGGHNAPHSTHNLNKMEAALRYGGEVQ